jgi:hypothetical protein
MPATTTLSRKILVFPSPTPAGLKLEGHVSDVHFTVSHRQPKLIAIAKQPDDAAAQPLSRKTSGYCWSTPQYRNWCAQHAFFEGKKAGETSPRKSTPRTLKEVGQQYPGVKSTVPQRRRGASDTPMGTQDTKQCKGGGVLGGCCTVVRNTSVPDEAAPLPRGKIWGVCRAGIGLTQVLRSDSHRYTTGRRAR